MKQEIEVEIVNLKGLHARASARLVKLASTFDAKITVYKEGYPPVDATSILGLLTLDGSKGTMIRITADGAESSRALEELRQLVQSGFNEND